MLLTIEKFGDRAALVLPDELLAQAHLKPGDIVQVTHEAGGMLVVGPGQIVDTESMRESRELIREFDEISRGATT